MARARGRAPGAVSDRTGKVLTSEHWAWALACCVSWAVCYPFFGPILGLVGVAIASHAFAAQVESVTLISLRRPEEFRLSWRWRRLVTPQNIVFCILWAVPVAIAFVALQPMAPAYRWGGTVALAMLAACSLAAAGVHLAPKAEAPRALARERFIAGWAAVIATFLGGCAFIIHDKALAVAYGEASAPARYHLAGEVISWLNDQFYGSLFGPSYERPYWPLLATAAGLLTGGVTAGLRAHVLRAAAARNPFAEGYGESAAHGQVFLSYAREDSGTARKLSDSLKDHVREVWVDWQGINPSERWRESIADAIRGSHAMIVLVSRNSLRSAYCWEECRQAIEQHKRILPVIVDPELASGDLTAVREAGWGELTAYQHLDMTGPEHFDEDIRRIVSFIAQEFRWVAGHTRLGIRAHEWWESGLSNGFLLRADELRAAEWLRDHHPRVPDFKAELTDRELKLIASSTRAVRRRAATFRVGATAVALALASLGSLVVVAQQGAETQRRASVSRALAKAAARTPGGRMDLRALISTAAYAESGTVEARKEMAEALLRFNDVRRLLPAGGARSHAFGFSRNGDVLAVERDDGTTQLWSTANWHLRATLPGSLPNGADQGLSADGRSVALVDGSRVIVTDTATRRTRATFTAQWKPGALGWDGGLSADGRTVSMHALEAETTQVWSVPDRRAIAEWPCSPSLSPSGRAVWCAGKEEAWFGSPRGDRRTPVDKDLRLVGWSAKDEPVVDNDREAMLLPRSGRGRPWTPGPGLRPSAVSEDGSRLLTASGGTRAIWDLVHRRKLGTTTAERMRQSGRSVSAAEDDGDIAALADLPPTHGMYLTVQRGVVEPVTSVALERDLTLSPDGRWAAATTASGDTAIWDRDPHGRIVSRFPGPAATLTASALSPSGDLLSVAGSDDRLRLLHTSDGTVTKTIRLRGSAARMAYSEDGSRLAVAETRPAGFKIGADEARQTVVEVFDLRSGRRAALLTSPAHPDPKERNPGLAFSPDGRLVYLAQSQAATVFAWDVRSARVVRSLGDLRQSGFVDGMFLSPDGRALLTVDRQAVGRIWDTRRGKVTRVYKGVGNAAAFSRDARILAMTSQSGEDVQLLDTATHRALGEAVNVGYRIRAIHLSPVAGIALITSADDDAVHLWDLAQRGEIAPVLAHVTAQSEVDTTPNGTRAWAADDDAVVSVALDPGSWRRSLCDLAGRRMAKAEWRNLAPQQLFRSGC